MRIENLPMSVASKKVDDNSAMQILENKIEKLDLLNPSEVIQSTQSFMDELDIGISIERTTTEDSCQQSSVPAKKQNKTKPNMKWKKILLKWLQKQMSLVFKNAIVDKKMLKKLREKLNVFIQGKHSKFTDKYMAFLQGIVAEKKDIVLLVKKTSLEEADKLTVRKMILNTINKYVN